MAEETTRFKIPYPSEGQAAYFDVFQAMMNVLDSLDFADFEERNSIIFGGGNLSWDLTGANNLIWDANIEIATPTYGQKITILPSASLLSASGLGGIVIPSGNFMYIDATRGPTGALTLDDVEVGPQLPISSVAQVICYHDPASGSLFFATGLLLVSGGSTATGIVPFNSVTVTITDGNAVSIMGVPICLAAPTNGQVLVYDVATNEWCPQAPSPGTAYNFVVGTDNYATYNPNNAAGKQTIADAITDATALIDPNNGVTAVIYIQEGVYTEDLTIPGGISLVGAGCEWGSDDTMSRTRIIGQHAVTPFTHAGAVPYDKVLASTNFKGIEFRRPYDPIGLAAVTIQDVGLGVQAICNLSFSNCVRWEQDVLSVPPQAMVNVTPFLSGVLANAEAEVIIHDCKLGGGYPKVHGLSFDDYACIRLEGDITITIRDSDVSYEAAPIGPDLEWVGPAVKVVGATLDVQRSELRGGVFGDTATMTMRQSEWLARWVDGANEPKSGFYNLNDSVVTVSDSTLYSNEGLIEGNVFFFYRFSGNPLLDLNAVSFMELTGMGVNWRAGGDSNWIVISRSASTPNASYLMQAPGDDTGNPTTESGIYNGADTKVTGKLTVTGLIDPTGLILTEEGEASVPTVANEGAIFVSDGTGGAPNTNSLYYKDEVGTLTDLLGGGAPVDATYVVIATDAALTNERVLTGAVANVSVVDSGAGLPVTIDLVATGVAAGAYNFADVTVDANGRITAIADGMPQNMTPDIDLASSPYTVDTAPGGDVPNYIIAIDCTAGGVAINLPSAGATTRGREMRILDNTGNCGVGKPIDLWVAGAETINGVTNGATGAYSLVTAYSSVTIVCDGVSQWNIVALA